MQFQVPQFIETEDRIVGPLSLVQFLYLAAGAGVCFGLFFLVTFWVWIIFLVLFGGLTVSMAFVKVEGRPFPHVLAAALRYFWSPQQYAWQRPTAAAPAKSETYSREGSSSVEKIVRGLALKSAWRTVQTGSKAPDIELPAPKKGVERYEIFRGITGENRAARRVDYR